MCRQIPAAKGLHTVDALACAAGRGYSCGHVGTGGRGAAAADAHAGIVDERKDDITCRHPGQFLHHINMVGGDPDGPHKAFGLGGHQGAPCALAHGELTAADLVQKKDVDIWYAESRTFLKDCRVRTVVVRG